jgi:hypothetical protein
VNNQPVEIKFGLQLKQAAESRAPAKGAECRLARSFLEFGAMRDNVRITRNVDYFFAGAPGGGSKKY